MKYITDKRKQTRGAALGLVLVFMTFMFILGTGLITLSEHTARQSAANVIADRHYYAAESAAQLGAQILLNELTQLNELKKEYSYKEILQNSPPNMADIKSDFKSEIYTKLQNVYLNDVVSLINGLKFNNEEVRLAEELLSIDDISVDGDYELARDPDRNETYVGAVYWENPTFAINATSGGRTITIQSSFSTEFTLETTISYVNDPDNPGNSPIGSGAVFQDKVGGIYGTVNNEELYYKYLNGLNKLVNTTDEKYAFYTGNTVNIIPIVNDTAFTSIRSEFNWNNAVNAKHINTWSPVELGKEGEITEYPNLEYILSDNPIRIRGTVLCPKLKGVVVTGGDFYGTLYTPKLEHMNLRGGNMTIHPGAKINPMEVDESGDIINRHKPSNEDKGNNYYLQSVLYVNADAEINWCRFNAANIDMNYRSGGKLTSNSIFISRGWVKLSGTASSDISRVIPQFYMRGYVEFGANLGSVAGIFMTPNTGYAVNNGNGLSPDTSFTGLLLGNFDQHYPPGPVLDTPPSPFGDKELSILMDGGWINEFTGEGGSGDGATFEIIEVEVNFESEYEDLNIREITGKTP